MVIKPRTKAKLVALAKYISTVLFCGVSLNFAVLALAGSAPPGPWWAFVIFWCVVMGVFFYFLDYKPLPE